MTRSAEIAFSARENRFTCEAVEYRVEAWGDTPIGQLFASIRTKLRRRKAGRVPLSDPEIGELVWLLDNVIHHDYPAGTLRAFRRTLGKLRSAVLTEDAPVR
jgi:hypothetical protein